MSSRGEIKIKEVLEQNQIKFAREYIFPDLVSSSGRPLRFDFAVFDDSGELDYLIEFQGEQHYTSVKHFGGYNSLKRQKHNDSLKRQFCLRRDIPLVEIPYWEYDEVDFDYIYYKAEGMRY